MTDSESRSIPWSRAEAQETCSHDGIKAGQEREVEAEQQSGKVHCTTGGEPLLEWKHGVKVKGREGGGEAAARAMR